METLSATLPKLINNASWEELENKGVQRIGNDGDLFVKVELPAGWKKQATEYPVWSDLLDDKGRRRANIFYDHYDCRAYMEACRRYTLGYKYDDEDKTYYVQVLDGEAVLYQTGAIIQLSDDATDEMRNQYFGSQDSLKQEASDWLDEHFPNWKDRTAYWE